MLVGFHENGFNIILLKYCLDDSSILHNDALEKFCYAERMYKNTRICGGTSERASEGIFGSPFQWIPRRIAGKKIRGTVLEQIISKVLK